MPQFFILFYANCAILATQWGAMAPCPPKIRPRSKNIERGKQAPSPFKIGLTLQLEELFRMEGEKNFIRGDFFDSFALNCDVFLSAPFIMCIKLHTNKISRNQNADKLVH